MHNRIFLESYHQLLNGDFVYRTATPLNIVESNGVRLKDKSGKIIIDMHAASGACMLGYRSDILHRGVARMTSLPSKPQFCETENRIELAGQLAAMIDRHTGQRGRIGFDLGGAQAIEQALKIVSARDPSANIIFTLDGAYHGRSIASSFLSCSSRYLTGLGTNAFKNLRLPVPALKAQQLNCDLERATEICVREVQALFSDERFGLCGGSQRFHSFLFEPILNVAGMIPVSPDYLAIIVGLVKAGGGAIIADEIFTGFFKTANLFGSNPLFPDVDVVAMSKFLTNGIAPLSCVWVREESGLAETYKPGTHSCTYINNELALGVALETLSELNGLSAQTLTAPNAILSRMFSHLPIKEIGATAMVIDNVAKIIMPNKTIFNQVKQQIEKSEKLGVLMATTGLAENTFIFHPAFTLSEVDADLAAEVLSSAMRTIV